MPPTSVHFNGSVNLPDAETVMREIAARVPDGLRRVPDGEPGDRGNWIFFQLQKFRQSPAFQVVSEAGAGPGAGAATEPGGAAREADAEAEQGGASEQGRASEQGGPESAAAVYRRPPGFRLAEGVTPDTVEWPDPGYADAYTESFAIFTRLAGEGVLPEGVRFQAEYPTPQAVVSGFAADDQFEAILGSYERTLSADLSRFLAAVPHDRVAVQWDVAVEFRVLESGGPGASLEAIVANLARCVDKIPADVPAGLHLCYGDYMHRHFAEPESLGMQIRVLNEVTAAASRPVNFVSFTVPQYQRASAYFAPLRHLAVGPQTELYFALVPYYPARQAPGTTAEQIRLVDEFLDESPAGSRDWGICTECGMGRVAREDVPALLDLHREILASR